ncbi:hypothetical protein ACWD3P_37680 [Streptomyces sp. NPDC002765]|uniref:hypothetical protein n=1 Tax=Streptomyces sp. C1-1 TaxID=3231173 RepID=UPI003D006A89
MRELDEAVATCRAGDLLGEHGTREVGGTASAESVEKDADGDLQRAQDGHLPVLARG